MSFHPSLTAKPTRAERSPHDAVGTGPGNTAIWAAATLPVMVLAWVVAPRVVPRIDLPAILTFWLVLLPGALWQLALSLWVIRREEGGLSGEVLRRRMWLTTPRHPRTGEPHPRLVWRAVPWALLLLVSLAASLLVPFLLLRLLSGTNFAESPLNFLLGLPAYTNLSELSNPEFAGRWGLLILGAGLWAVIALGGEELLFRGVLLPRMAGRGGWLANAAGFALYYLHRPLLIPLRLLDGIALARPAYRLRSNWLALAVRCVEGAFVLGLLLVGVLTPTLGSRAIEQPLPYVEKQPEPTRLYRGALPSVPQYTGSGNAFEVDLRGANLSALDLRGAEDLWYATFDTNTVWRAAEQMPAEFDPELILEIGKDPGLGVRELHAQGITGSGVGIAIIDQPLLTEHEEHAARLQWYEEAITTSFPSIAAMHGAVVSLAAGETTGVAPGADLYYIGLNSTPARILAAGNMHYYADGIRRILAINEQLPADQTIRVISMSTGWQPAMPGYYDLLRAVDEAKRSGVFVVNAGMQAYDGYSIQGLGRFPLADPNDFNAYEPGVFWERGFYEGRGVGGALLLPMDSRTVASASGSDEYEFARIGGISWSVPYVAGLYALAAQVEPDITPEVFWALAMETGRTVEVERDGQVYPLGRIVDPVALIGALQE